jgi:hypothetical protein
LIVDVSGGAAYLLTGPAPSTEFPFADPNDDRKARPRRGVLMSALNILVARFSSPRSF